VCHILGPIFNGIDHSVRIITHVGLRFNG